MQVDAKFETKVPVVFLNLTETIMSAKCFELKVGYSRPLTTIVTKGRLNKERSGLFRENFPHRHNRYAVSALLIYLFIK